MFSGRACVFSAPVAVLAHRALAHPNGQESPAAGSRLQAEADEAAPNGRAPGTVLGLLTQRGALADAPSADHITEGSAAIRAMGRAGRLLRGGPGAAGTEKK